MFNKLSFTLFLMTFATSIAQKGVRLPTDFNEIIEEFQIIKRSKFRI